MHTHVACTRARQRVDAAEVPGARQVTKGTADATRDFEYEGRYSHFSDIGTDPPSHPHCLCGDLHTWELLGAREILGDLPRRPHAR